jgi:hypothetical protein
MLARVALTIAVSMIPQWAHAAEPKEIIEQAIKASGGAEAINKQKAFTWSETGKYYGMGDGLDFKGKCAYQAPDKFRVEIENVFTMGLDGKTGWTKTADGTVADLTGEKLKTQLDQIYLSRVVRLAPLTGKKFKLADAGEEKVGDHNAVGVKVSSEGHPDVTLYFDKESHLLVKTSVQVYSEEESKEVKQESSFSDYKEFGGVKQPMKYVAMHDGKRYIEAEISDFKVVDKLDESMFKKPE